MLNQAWHPLINVLKRLSNTRMNGSREDTAQELERPAGGGPPWQRTSIPRTTGDWPIFKDNAAWVAQTRIQVRRLRANGFEAVIRQWLTAVREKTSTMYINIISGQPPHDDGGEDDLRNVGFLSTTDTACCPRRFFWFHKMLSFWWGVITPAPPPKQEDHPPSASANAYSIYSQLLSIYLEASTSIRNLRTRYAVVTRDPLNMIRLGPACLKTLVSYS
jgi:hypothetical protein